MLDIENNLVKNHHYLILFINLGFYPKMMYTLNEKLENIRMNIRVGQGLDVVGQVGKPRKITGF